MRRYAPKDAEEIDFATLEELNTELVGEALVRRYPDMLWTARSTDGSGQVVILLEFQATQDPLMPLRIAIYQLLAVESLLRRIRGTTPARRLKVLSCDLPRGGPVEVCRDPAARVPELGAGRLSNHLPASR